MNASLYFAITCIAIIVIPVTGYLLTRAIGKAIVKTIFDWFVFKYKFMLEATKLEQESNEVTGHGKKKEKN